MRKLMNEDLNIKQKPVGLKERLIYNNNFELLKSDPSEFTDAYQLKWLGKNYAKLEYSLAPDTVIIPNIEHNEKQQNEDSQNIFISGDNLQVLKHLRYAYSNSIKMIYIDPPYNTGSGDFVYNDSFSISDDKLRDKFGLNKKEIERLHTLNDSSSHSAWLTFMYPRLRLAKELLKEDGVIFISIDDNEQSNLKLLCDEIFGEINFYGKIIQYKGSTQNDSKTIQRNADYILCYVKNYFDLLVTYNNYTEKRVYEDKWYLGRDTGASSGHDKLIDRPKLGYTIYYLSNQNGVIGNNNRLIDSIRQANKLYPGFNYFEYSGNIKHAIAIHDYDKDKIDSNSREEDVYQDIQELIDLGYIKIRPPLRKGNKLGRWTWGIDSFRSKWNNNEVYIKDGKNVIQKVFVEPNAKIIEKNGKKFVEVVNKLALQNVLNQFPTAKGTEQLNKLFPEYNNLFNNPKNVDMIKYFIKSSTKKDDVILDFFAGSGTTAHAVMSLNKEDSSDRKYILIQLNELTKSSSEANKSGYRTIDEITKARIERAAVELGDISGYKHYYVKELSVQTIDRIEEFDPNINELIIAENMVSEFDTEKATGEETILTTWLVADGYKLTEKVQTIDVAGYGAYYVDNSLLYIIREGFGNEQTKELINMIGTQKLNVTIIIIYGYSFSRNVMSLLEQQINIKQNLSKDVLDRQVTLEVRY